MAGRPPKVDHVRDSFLAASDSAKSLVDSVTALSGINPNSKCPRLHTEHARRVVELAFLGMVSAWEEFLEQSFVRYLAGAVADGGYSPAHRMGKVSDIAHAYHVISGDPSYDPEKHYSKFGEPKWVIATARLYFETGSPYATRMQPKVEPLQYAVKLRNRVAHSSIKVRSDFRAVAKKHLNLDEDDPLKQGYALGALLQTKTTRLFGAKARDNEWTYFEAYRRMYRSLAKKIVPYKS